MKSLTLKTKSRVNNALSRRIFTNRFSILMFLFCFFMRFARFQIIICEFIFIYIHIIFNPNQEKNLLGYKVVDNSKNLNSVHLEQAYCNELTLSKVFQKSNLFLICFWIFSAHKLTYLTLAKSLLKLGSYETVSRLIMKVSL